MTLQPTHYQTKAGWVRCAMGRHAFGSFSASRRDWWAIRHCIYFGSARGYASSLKLTPAIKHIVKRIFEYAWPIFQKNLSFRATVDFVGFCVLASPADRRSVWKLLSATRRMLHTRPQPEPANWPHMPSISSVWLLSWRTLPQISF